MNELALLNEHKSSGPDNIPSIVLKNCAAQLALPILNLLRKTMKCGELPQGWKKGKGCPNSQKKR